MNNQTTSVLYILPGLDCPPRSGSGLFVLEPLLHMQADCGIEVDIMFTAWEEAHIQACREFLQQIPVVKSIFDVAPEHGLDGTTLMPKHLYAEIWKSMNARLKDKAVNMVTLHHYDVIRVDYSYMAWIVPALRLASPHSKIVLALHHAEHVLCERALPYITDEAERDSAEKEYKLVKTWEHKTWNWFDAAICVSDKEAGLFAKVTDGLPTLLAAAGGGVHMEKYEPKATAEKDLDILYMGSLENKANVQALKWFVQHVLPLILQQHPKLTFHIAGLGAPDNALMDIIQQIGHVKFWGEIDDDADFFHRAKVFVVPLFIGAGARVKIPVAWASRCAVVSTTVGAEGLRCEPEKNIIIADAPAAFAQGVLRLYDDAAFASDLADCGFRTAQTHYSAVESAARLAEFYVSCANNNE